MDEATRKKINLYLERESGGQYEDEDASLAEGKEKFKSVLQDGKGVYDEENYQRIRDEIIRFINLGEAQEYKLYNYCLSFYDPYPKEEKEAGSGAEVERHRFLSSDELIRLSMFVKDHKKDKTLGMIINQIMYEHKLTAPQVYVAAMISRQDFSRIVNSNKGVGKYKIWSVIIGLRCNIDEADMVLFGAGYVRKRTVTDLIIEYFIKTKNYDILAINEVLFEHGQKLLSVYSEVKDKDSAPEKKRKSKKDGDKTNAK